MVQVFPDFKKDSTYVSFGRIKSPATIPCLIDIQLQSYKDFLQVGMRPAGRESIGLQSVFLETFPIESANGDVFLEFVEYTLGEPKSNVWDCKLNDASYTAPLKALIRLIVAETGEVREQEVYMGDLPIMTPTGTFVASGVERVVVNQLHRSPGIFVFADELKDIYVTRIIPDYKGSWLEFEMDAKNLLVARIDRKKKFPFTLLVRCLGYGTNEEVLRLFYKSEELQLKGVAIKKLHSYLNRKVISNVVDLNTKEVLMEAGQPLNEDNIEIMKEVGIEGIDLIVNPGSGDETIVIQSLEKDGVTNEEEALVEFLKIHKPLDHATEQGDPEKKKQNVERAKIELHRLFFDPKTYNLGRVGRYKINAKFKMINPDEFHDRVDSQTLRPIDIIEALRYMINAISEVEGYQFDDIDHLGNRRVRTVGELLTLQLKAGFSRMERVVKERMTMNDMDVMTPQLLISIKPITAVINEFFGASQLSQFMDQTNPLSEITHKRRLNALGPGGLTRERAGFEVRDVHYTHYGRVCPIETPEGPNIGLIISMAVHAKLNPYGFLETPYRMVEKGRVTEKVVYLSANEEDHYVVAQASSPISPRGEFLDNLVSCRYRGNFPLKNPDEIQLMDVDPMQIVSLSAGLIPFLEHDDANRALMGSNMQRQAVPLVHTEAPIVATGLEKIINYDAGICVIADRNGVVSKVDAQFIEVFDESRKEKRTYPLLKYKRTNQSSCLNHIPVVHAYYAPEKGKIKQVNDETLNFVGESGKEYEYPMKTFQSKMKLMVTNNASVDANQWIAGEVVIKEVKDKNGQVINRGTILADGHSSYKGSLSLGKNIMVAFMPWHGYNFEDAIIVSERLVKEDIFTSIHIEEFELQARETKLGKELITRDIPNITERAFRDLDEDGIIRLGAEVQPGDILVGMVTPKGETDLTPEYRLLHSIFGEKAREVKDSSLRVPNGHGGIVIEIKKFSRDSGDDLMPGISEIVKVYIAQKRKLSVGDKMAGRHGNKGVISTIFPEHEMPFLADGTPIDIILNPLGVPSRMNLGQIFESQLGWAGKELGIHFETPVFNGVPWSDIVENMEKAKLSPGSKVRLRDGRTGESFEQLVFAGVIYMLKLSHMIDDKMHARSTGPYSLITQQPLGGKAQFGGQRMGEMEVWALEAYGAAHTLQELLTVKSDDMLGRARVYESIVKGIHAMRSGIPESFNVLLKEIRSLALDISVVNEDGESVDVGEYNRDYDYKKASRRIKIDSVG